MTWPTDTLTNTHTDNPLDRPDLARDEINSAILMVKSILGEAPAGSLLLTNQDEGAGNGLDADTLDGEHASAFANASHNHAASEITSGAFSIARGGTGRGTTITTGAVLTGNGLSELIGVNGNAGQFLKSNGTGSTPTYVDLPSFPTVDVHASDFINGSVSVFPDSNVYDFNTGFGDNNFQWGITGLNSGNAILTGYQSITGYQSYHHQTAGGITATTPNISGIAAGHIRFGIVASGGPWTAYVWARKNI